MLHDTGRLTLASQLTGPYKEVLNAIRVEGVSVVDAEWRVFGTARQGRSGPVGPVGLPDALVEAVARHHNPAALLQETLDKEDEADKKLTELAETVVNVEAEEADGEESEKGEGESDEEEEPAPKAKKKTPSKKWAGERSSPRLPARVLSFTVGSTTSPPNQPKGPIKP